MSITFDSKFVYIAGISGAYTHEQAEEILAELSKVVNAAQHRVHPTGLNVAQKEEVRQMIQSALDTGSA